MHSGWIVNLGSIHMLVAQSELVKQPAATKIWAKLTTMMKIRLFSRQIFSADNKAVWPFWYRFLFRRCSNNWNICFGNLAVGELTSDIYYWTGAGGQNYRRQNGVHDIFVSIAMRNARQENWNWHKILRGAENIRSDPSKNFLEKIRKIWKRVQKNWIFFGPK